jgi:AcrR family transcriptional regulator
MAERAGKASGGGGSTAAGAGRRAEILAVAERLFAQKSYHATSMDDVADAVGVTKPAIYHYFRSKEDILLEIRQSIIDDALELVDGVLEAAGRPADKLRDILVAHTTTVLTRRRANKIFYEEQGLLSADRERAIRRAERRYEKVLHRLYEDGIAAGELRGADPGIAVATLLGACNWSYRWFKPRGRLSAEEMAQTMVELLLEGHLTGR